MIKEVILIVVSLILLIKASDIFVNSSIDLAKKIKVPEVVIGATIVTVGTTLPELLVSTISAIKGHSDISFSNGVGSIIFNAGIIASATMLFGNNMLLKKQREMLKLPIVLFMVSSVIVIMAFIEKVAFIRLIGVILAMIFIAYCYIMCKTEQEEIIEAESNKTVLRIIIELVISAVMLAISSNLLVDNAVIIARMIGISEKIIGITILAVGTSLPEFTTAITSIRKNHNALSFGNIVGANLFDITLVTGVPIIFNPYTSNELDLMVTAIILMTLIGIIVFTGKRKKMIAILMLVVYISYIGNTIIH